MCQDPARLSGNLIFVDSVHILSAPIWQPPKYKFSVGSKALGQNSAHILFYFLQLILKVF